MSINRHSLRRYVYSFMNLWAPKNGDIIEANCKHSGAKHDG